MPRCCATCAVMVDGLENNFYCNHFGIYIRGFATDGTNCDWWILNPNLEDENDSPEVQ